MSDHEIFEAGDVLLQSGMTLRGARLAYATHGALNRDKNNVVIILTPFGARHGDCEYLFGDGRAVDPEKHFIIIPNLLGNGLSSSPSNTPPPFDRARFPNISIYDNVRLQHRLVSDILGIDKVALVMGHSMGSLQTFQWAALFPDMVERIAPICGAARTSRHNRVFLAGMKAVLELDPAWRQGWYDEPPVMGLRTLGRAWAASPPSQGFYRQEKYLELGFSSIEDFLTGYWERMFLGLDANNILTHIWTWRHADISANSLHGGDFEKALGAIKAKAIVMPGQTDIYFPPEDSAYEVAHMANAAYRPIPSIWGHWAGAAKSPADGVFIDKALKELLAD
jgi:homoserine O-acetyltransferase